MTSETLGLIFNLHLLKIQQRSARRENGGEVQKFEYLQNQRSFFVKIENIFRNFKYIMGHTDIWRQKLRLFRELDISFTLIKRCFSMMHISNKSGFAKFFHWYNAYFSKYDYCADWLCKRIYFQDLITTKFWLE